MLYAVPSKNSSSSVAEGHPTRFETFGKMPRGDSLAGGQKLLKVTPALRTMNLDSVSRRRITAPLGVRSASVSYDDRVSWTSREPCRAKTGYPTGGVLSPVKTRPATPKGRVSASRSRGEYPLGSSRSARINLGQPFGVVRS